MKGERKNLLQRLLVWREKNIKEKRFILILSFLVGIFTALAALILKMLIHWIQTFLTENFNTLLEAINKAKPAAAKGQYIRSCVVAATMGPGVKINPNKVG